jgi:predicted nucleotidyltransferase component of viral defense system
VKNSSTTYCRQKLLRFIQAIQDKDYLDIIHFADQEATKAERDLYRRKGESTEPKEYAEMLKDLIFYIRYGVKPQNIGNAEFQLFRSVCEDLAKRRETRSRC